MKKGKLDLILLLSVILLTLFGILMIYSSSYVWAEYKYNDPFKYIKAQSIFFFLGLIAIFIIQKFNINILYKKANLILLICIVLLIAVLIPGIGVIRNGSRSWIAIGSLGFQPSELIKIGLIIFVSKYLSNNKLNNKLKNIVPIMLIIMLVFGLIMLEPDFGTGFVLLVSVLSLIIISDIKFSFFIKLGLLGLVGLALLIIAAPYRVKRLVSFINPWSDPLGSGFQIIQSLYAIGPGSLLGQGFMKSIQKHFYLPEPQTDFIFAIISEEFGFLGVLIITFIFFVIFYRSIKISLQCQNLFLKYLSFGLSFSIIFQTILNLMVVVGLIPVTGVTLPFLSYGGSSLLVSMASIGIILNISKNSK